MGEWVRRRFLVLHHDSEISKEHLNVLLADKMLYVCLKCGLKSKVLRVISILQHNQWCSVSLQQPGRGVQRQVFVGFLGHHKADL